MQHYITFILMGILLFLIAIEIFKWFNILH